MITAIAAIGRNRVIGNAGDVPWHIPEDWRRFKAVTWGSNLIMGRVTFEAIGDPLPGRTSIVISRSHGPSAGPADPEPLVEPEPPVQHVENNAPAADYTRSHEVGSTVKQPPTRVIRVHTLDEAIAACDPDRPVFVAGGAQIYDLAWPILTDLDITEVDQAPEGDAFFPEIDPGEWLEVSRDRHDGFDFVHYARREGSDA